MMSSMPLCTRSALGVLLAYVMSCSAYAQQLPITGQMGAPAAAPAIAGANDAAPLATPTQPSPAATSPNANADVGDVTRQLLGMQRQGTYAGKALPIPGPQASASYRRYLKSFEHPIPEFYETAVSKNGGGMSGSADSP
jgi:hypothetical protein